MRVDSLVPRAEKITLVLEAIGDDKVGIKSTSLDNLVDRYDFDGLVRQNHQRMVQTQRIEPKLVVGYPFDRHHDFLGRGKHEVIMLIS
jgi:hypothetical protein